MRFVPTQVSYFKLDGGVDQSTPLVDALPGTLRESQNFECDIDGGYSVGGAYQEYNGKSAYEYFEYKYVRATATDVLSAVIYADSAFTTLFYPLDQGADYVIGYTATGTVTAGQRLYKLGNPADPSYIDVIATETTAAPSAYLAATGKKVLRDHAASTMSPPTGDGGMRGIWYYGGKVWAIRDEVATSFADLHYCTPGTGGWTKFTQPAAAKYYYTFTQAGAGTPASATLTDGVDSATVYAAYLRSGSWGGGNAVGILVTNAAAPGAIAAAATYGGVNVTIGTQTEIRLQEGGVWEFVNHNFGGQAGAEKCYMVNGTGPAFQFDGTRLIPIFTGMTTDTPTHVAVYKNHLFLSFAGSAQHSSIGDPFAHSAVTGAGELAVGDTITGMLVLPGSETSGALALFSESKVTLLYGSSAADWNLATSTGLVALNDTNGARERSVQQLGYTFFVDDVGLTTLQTTSKYGNFEASSVSGPMREWMNARKNKVACSMVCRAKNQYRIYFTDKTALHVTLGSDGKLRLMPMLLRFTPNCAVSFTDASGNEVMLIGSADDGNVYQMDSGVCQNGENIEAFMYMAFNHIGSPRTRKRFRKVALDSECDGYAEYVASSELSYGSAEVTPNSEQTVENLSGAPAWDSAMWDAFVWDGANYVPDEVEMTGTGENFSLKIYTSSDMFSPMTFRGVFVHYTPRRNMR